VDGRYPENGRSEGMSYNGWENYETWAMALWIDNDEGSYHASREMARDALRFSSEGRSAQGTLADNLKEWQEEEMPDLEASVWADLLGSAFEAVDWYEIAENYLSESETA
jgi:hypothetical protein